MFRDADNRENLLSCITEILRVEWRSARKSFHLFLHSAIVRASFIFCLLAYSKLAVKSHSCHICTYSKPWRRVSIPSYSSFSVMGESFSKATNRLSLTSHWAELSHMPTPKTNIGKGLVLLWLAQTNHLQCSNWREAKYLSWKRYIDWGSGVASTVELLFLSTLNPQPLGHCWHSATSEWMYEWVREWMR